jgi:hypothetical protein
MLYTYVHQSEKDNLYLIVVDFALFVPFCGMNFFSKAYLKKGY